MFAKRKRNDGIDINCCKKKIGVKAVGLSRSRVNPKVPRDLFQDYDIVYVIENKDELLEDRG